MKRSAALAAVPLLLVALLIAGFVVWRPFDFLSIGVPPTEELVVERVVLDGEGIHAYVRAQGSAPLSIAQVQVDSAYRVFTVTPRHSARPFCDRPSRHFLSLGNRRSPHHPPPDRLGRGVRPHDRGRGRHPEGVGIEPRHPRARGPHGGRRAGSHRSGVPPRHAPGGAGCLAFPARPYRRASGVPAARHRSRGPGGR